LYKLCLSLKRNSNSWTVVYATPHNIFQRPGEPGHAAGPGDGRSRDRDHSPPRRRGRRYGGGFGALRSAGDRPSAPVAKESPAAAGGLEAGDVQEAQAAEARAIAAGVGP